MAQLTNTTILNYKSTVGGEYVKLTDITDYPDMGSAPNMHDTTNLSHTKMKTNKMGLQEALDLTFGANYNETDYATIDNLSGVLYFQLLLADGSHFEWQGEIRVFLNAGAVDEIRKMSIVTSCETEMEFTNA